MTTDSNVDVKSAAGAAAGQANSGAAGANFSETGHKAATDINTEEVLSLLQSLIGRDAHLNSGLLFANQKRTYDAYQSADLAGLGDQRVTVQQLQNVALQALQNAVETANMVGKQAVKHADNADSVQISILGKTGVQQDAMVAALVEQLREEVRREVSKVVNKG